jgi:hypothetical protein
MSAASTMAPALAPTPAMAPPAPPRRIDPQPQHMRALARANEIRLARAALKREIASGTMSAAEIVLRCPPEAEGMTVSELLSAQRRWGRARSRKLLGGLELKENKQLVTFTERQRQLLARVLLEKLADR